MQISKVLSRLFQTISLVLISAPPIWARPVVQSWASSEDMSKTLTRQPNLDFVTHDRVAESVIEVDEGNIYQTIIGIGSSLEHSTCYNISLLPEAERERVVESIVDPVKGIGMNLMRICIGTPDFTA
ncbi:MAG: hypothetical protein ACYTE3_14345, partial [Planctomycetota bacterium]